MTPHQHWREGYIRSGAGIFFLGYSFLALNFKAGYEICWSNADLFSIYLYLHRNLARFWVAESRNISFVGRGSFWLPWWRTTRKPWIKAFFHGENDVYEASNPWAPACDSLVPKYSERAYFVSLKSIISRLAKSCHFVLSPTNYCCDTQIKAKTIV